MRLLVILMALLLLGCAGSTDVGEKSAGTSPTPRAQEQSEQGVNASKLFEERCSCHYSYYENPSGEPYWLEVWENEYYGQPAEKWRAGIDMMVEKRFTSVTAEEKVAIAEYLSGRFGK